MSFNINDVKSTKKAGDKVSPTPMDGVQLGVIVQVIDLGVQPGGFYLGKPKPDSQRMWVTYELPNDTHDFDGETKPLLVSEDFPFSGSELSTCYKRMNSIDPGLKLTGGELSKLIGLPVQVMITHKAGKGKHEGRTFANVSAVSPLMRGMKSPDETYNPQFFYSPKEHDESIWQQLPDFMKEKVEARLDSAGRTVSTPKPTSNPTPQGTVDKAPEPAEESDSAW